MLRIDLTAMILSPLIAGQLMTSINVAAGSLFITAWNLCSWGIEFWLLNVVYAAVPALSVKPKQEDQALGNQHLFYFSNQLWIHVVFSYFIFVTPRDGQGFTPEEGLVPLGQSQPPGSSPSRSNLHWKKEPSVVTR